MLNVPLYPWQLEAVRYVVKHKYMILADDMGLGKSGSAIALQVWTGKKMLVVCPAYLKNTWVDEIEFFTNNKYKVYSSQTVDRLCPDADIHIINYELVKKASHLFKEVDIVVADEAHYLKSLVSQRTGHFHNYVFEYAPEYLMLMTGTPIKNTNIDIYSLLCLCSYIKTDIKDLNGYNILDRYPTQEDFEQMFVKKIRIGAYEKIVGSKNDKLLKRFLERKFLRRKKEDVLELGDYLEKDLVVSYKRDLELEEDWKEFNKNATKGISSKALSAQKKVKYTIDYAKEVYESCNSPVIIFTDHVLSCKELAEGLECIGIDGSVPADKRHVIKDEFQAGKHKFLVCTIGSMSTGFTLTASHQMIFNDLSWIPADNSQARDRIRRIGQTKVCNYHYILGSVSDKHIANLIKDKMKTINSIIEE